MMGLDHPQHARRHPELAINARGNHLPSCGTLGDGPVPVGRSLESAVQVFQKVGASHYRERISTDCHLQGEPVRVETTAHVMPVTERERDVLARREPGRFQLDLAGMS